jgi:fatty acyl-CoA reductase
MNVSGVLSIIALAQKMTNLKALVDVSTAYCNCDIAHIEERWHGPAFAP